MLAMRWQNGFGGQNGENGQHERMCGFLHVKPGAEGGNRTHTGGDPDRILSFAHTASSGIFLCRFTRISEL